MTKRMLLTLLILVMLAFASYAAWQQTKGALGVGVIALPSGTGTFQLPSASCPEVIPGEENYCDFWIHNQSSGPIHVDDYSVTLLTGDVVVDEVTMHSSDIEYDSVASLTVRYHVPPDVSPDVYVFLATVTCSAQ